jgi:hypothetical protein
VDAIEHEVIPYGEEAGRLRQADEAANMHEGDPVKDEEDQLIHPYPIKGPHTEFLI